MRPIHLLLPLLLTACLGELSSSAPREGGGDGPRAGGGPQGGGGVIVPMPCVRSGPGRVTAHRLNAVEYDNTLRDLLGEPGHPSAVFPADDSASGFDNNADALKIDALLFENFASAAESVALTAVAREQALPLTARTWLTCAPTSPATEASCARSAIATLLPRAFRRPVTQAELDRITAQYDFARTQGETFAGGLALALEAIVLSPSFLFRVEFDLDTSDHALDDFELASRLSYFLWSTMPDARLFSLAAAGQLHEEATLEAEVTRMLADPRAQSLVQNFAGQWLELRNLDGVTPDVALFPSFDPALQQGMRDETELVFSELMTTDRSFLDLVDLDFTFVDARLAAHYGLSPVVGTQRVQLGAGARGGILTHASVLTVTSNADRTSPVRRGQFALGQLLCSEPPPPPVNVAPLPPPTPGGTLRQQLEAHRASPACSGCHAEMDPVGFALEGFDAIGAVRTLDNGQPLDTTGVFPDGRSFSDGRSLSKVLRADPRLSPCVTQKLVTYALGRVMTPDDVCAVEQLTSAVAARDHHFTDWISLIVKDPMFTRRQGVAP